MSEPAAQSEPGSGHGSERSQITRLREKARTERTQLNALLDSCRIGHFALVGADGEPRIVPTAVVRDGDRVLAHGSTGSPWMRRLADGVPTSLAVTEMSGLVVARSGFESSIHYRSAVLFGQCGDIVGTAKQAAVDVITDALLPGRVAELRRPTEREIAATLVLALPIGEWSLKVSDAWPEDAEEDLAADAWAGVVPIATSYGPALPAPDLRPGIDVPASVRTLVAGS
jgi:uncharacterized protein